MEKGSRHVCVSAYLSRNEVRCQDLCAHGQKSIRGDLEGNKHMIAIQTTVGGWKNGEGGRGEFTETTQIRLDTSCDGPQHYSAYEHVL